MNQSTITFAICWLAGLLPAWFALRGAIWLCCLYAHLVYGTPLLEFSL